jgi:RNA polymerase sigma factor (sigma-70 family)
MQLYKDHYEQVRRYFAGHVECPQDVEDLVQTVFLNLMANSGDLTNPRRYVQAVARHQLYAYWRHKRAGLDIERILSVRSDNCGADATADDPDSNPLEELSHKEMQQLVGSLISHLSPALAEALRLRFLNDLRPEEAARRAGCSREALKKRLKRAKCCLAGCLAAGGAHPG